MHHLEILTKSSRVTYKRRIAFFLPNVDGKFGYSTGTPIKIFHFPEKIATRLSKEKKGDKAANKQ